MSSKSYPKADQLQIKGNKVFSVVRKTWVVLTPEEQVRQDYLRVLVHEYGYSIDQIAEEIEVTGRGAGQARADFVVWKSTQDRRDNKNPLIVVECKSDNVSIKPEDYSQGDNYGRLSGARFFVTHNSRETKFWRTVHDKMPKSLEEIANIPHADASDKEIEELISKLKVFKEDEFAKLLHDCHNVIRNREKLDPAAAFDEIAKILFIKVYVERELRAKRSRKNLFTVEFLDEQIGKHPLNTLFKQTKEAYEEDKIFESDEEIRLKPATGREIIKRLERYNLSDTSEDIKGIAFERFLGKTFRGEIGQFFTPRTIVEFMIRMVDPKEGEIICDPASGSGGFLIRFFEIVREQILADVDSQYQAFKRKIERQRIPEPKIAEALRKKFNELQTTIDQQITGSRLWNLANRCIYGTDANDRMARTSKINMIMHGDGHGGVHHHDGFINVNGVFEGRFDIVLTNPPFGANVEASDVIHEADLFPSREVERRYQEEYGGLYIAAMDRVRASIGRPVTSLFQLPKNAKSKIKTEILFIERCLALLKPGGRLGIVLPEGLFNNSSLGYVRDFCEHRAFIKGVVGLPEETFTSAGTTVKASLLFLQKFTEEEQSRFDAVLQAASAEVAHSYDSYIRDETARIDDEIEAAKAATDIPRVKALKRELSEFHAQMAVVISLKTRELLKQRFDYPIFMYEAARVGITATGEEDLNELSRLPKDNLPINVIKSSLEYFEEFRRDAQTLPSFEDRVIGLTSFPSAFRVYFKDLSRRWDPGSFCALNWKWDDSDMASVGSVLSARRRKVDRKQVHFRELQPLTIHFDGSVERRSVPEGREYTMELFYAEPGDLVVSKIDLKNGAVGIIPDGWMNVVVTGHFAVYEIDQSRIRPAWLLRIVQQPDFKEYLWRNKVGAEGRKEVKLDFFESIPIPVPELKIQDSILQVTQSIVAKIQILNDLLKQKELDVDEMIHGAKSIYHE